VGAGSGGVADAVGPVPGDVLAGVAGDVAGTAVDDVAGAAVADELGVELGRGRRCRVDAPVLVTLAAAAKAGERVALCRGPVWAAAAPATPAASTPSVQVAIRM